MESVRPSPDKVADAASACEANKRDTAEEQADARFPHFERRGGQIDRCICLHIQKGKRVCKFRRSPSYSNLQSSYARVLATVLLEALVSFPSLSEDH